MPSPRPAVGRATLVAAAILMLAAGSAGAAVSDPQDSPAASAVGDHGNTGAMGVIQEYQLASGSSPAEIVTGPDARLWFTAFGSGEIGRSTTDGTVDLFSTGASGSTPDGITVGPDGNLWFADTGSSAIGSVTLNGTITEWKTPWSLSGLASGPAEITSGPDGALWFTDRRAHRIGRIALDGTMTSILLPTPTNQPLGITLGPDGNLWFTEAPGNRLGKITPSGEISEFPVLPHPGSQPWEITAGPDGNLWFTERLGDRIGRMSTDGTLTEFAVPTAAAFPNTIRPGPDANAAHDCLVEQQTLGVPAFTLKYGGAANAFGACVAAHASSASLWFTEEGGKVAEITTTGVITEFAVPTPASTPLGITKGPDGEVWFTEFTSNRLGRLGIDNVGPR